MLLRPLKTPVCPFTRSLAFRAAAFLHYWHSRWATRAARHLQSLLLAPTTEDEAEEHGDNAGE